MKRLITTLVTAFALLAPAAHAAGISWSPGPKVLTDTAIHFSAPDAPAGAGWDFDGDQTIERSGAQATHRFSDEGDHTVRLLAADGTVLDTATVPVVGTYTQAEVRATEAFIPVSTPGGLQAGPADTTTLAPAGTPLLNEQVQIDATIYEPDPSVVHGPWPAVLAYPGWNTAKDAYDNFGPNGCGGYAREGFVCVSFTPRGWGSSSGWIGLADTEIQDVKDIISWLADRRAHDGTSDDVYGYANQPLDFDVQLDGPNDPRVGLFGESVGGTTTMVSAGREPRLDAVAAVVPAANNWFVATFGGIARWVFDTAFLGISYGGGFGHAPVDAGPRNPTLFATRPGIVAGPDQKIALWVIEAFAGLDDNAKADLEARSPITYDKNVAIPTMTFNGWYDWQHPVNAPIDNYEALKHNPYFSSLGERRRQQLKMQIFPAGHSGAPNGNVNVHGKIHLWFQHWLQGRDGIYRGVVSPLNGSATLPPVRISDFIDSPPVQLLEYRGPASATVSTEEPKPWADAAAFDRWKTAGDYPQGSHHWDPYVGVDERLYDDWPPPTTQRTFTLDFGTPAQFTNTIAHGLTNTAQDSQIRQSQLVTLDTAPGSSVSWTSAPLNGDLPVIGQAFLRAHLSTLIDGPLPRGPLSLHYVAKVYDIDPSGAEDPYLALRGYQALRVGSNAMPGTRLPIDFDLALQNMDWTFPRGHELRVVLSHEDAANVIPSLLPTTTFVEPTALPTLTVPVADS